MITYNDSIIIFLLSNKLNGHNDIAKYIVYLRNKIEMKNRCLEVIETNFYNWLTYDISRREDVRNIKCDISDRTSRYYYLNQSVLGLDNDYRRIRGLTECFKSDWWKYTYKNNIEWDDIHKSIRSDICIFRPGFGGIISDSPFFDNDMNWIKLSNVKSKKIINKLMVESNVNYYLQLTDIGALYVDSFLNPILII